MNIKGAGRKPKEEEDRKGKNLKIRLSEHDLSRIQKLHGSSHVKNRSDLVRDILLKQTIQVQIVHLELESVLIELNQLLSQVRYVIGGRSKDAMGIKYFIKELEGSLLETRQQMNKLSVLTLDDLQTDHDF